MSQSFCTECGDKLAESSRFCTSCGHPQGATATSPSNKDEHGPLSLPMPEGLPSIRLDEYEGPQRAEAITLINRLTSSQREVWVAAGQPDILLWPGGDFATWLGAIAPDHYRAAKAAQPQQANSAPAPLPGPAQPSNSIAIAGFVLSIVGIFTFFAVLPAILGLIFGILGASKAREWEVQGEEPKGKGLSIAAISISSVALLISLSTIGLWW